jgi:isopentenyl-diphosphate Delta-isomerase
MSELIMEVDENNQRIGIRPREDFHDGKYIHRGTHVILRNSKGEILVQTRPMNKERSPGKLSFSAGGTVGDESYEECILRETKEELGIDIQLESSFEFRNKSADDNVFHRIFLATNDDDITLQKEEIDSVQRVNAADLKEDLGKHPDKYSYLYRMCMQIYFDTWDT